MTAPSSVLTMLGLLGSLLGVPPRPTAPSTDRRAAEAVLDTAIARLGGIDTLRAVRGARFEIMTQWRSITFDETQGDQASYEMNSELRDYALDAWRNTRHVGLGSAQPREIVDVVRDSVAIRRSLGGSGGLASPAFATPGSWAPLNVAYVQEKDELFIVSPDRLLLASRAATDLVALRDTTIGGAAYARVAATVRGFHTTTFFRRSTGFPAFVRFRADENDDFGLTPFGTQEVEYRFSGWQRYASGLVYPTQFEVRRAGRPYKRLTLMSARFDLPAMPDSFAISDSLRVAFVASARRPMHDIAFGPAKLLEERFATFNVPGAPTGAVKVGDAWVLLEAGQAPLSAERAFGRLGELHSGAVADAIVTAPMMSSGGAAWLATHGVRVSVAPGSAPFMDEVFRGHGLPRATVRVERTGRWYHIGGDSLRIEPIDYADVPGAVLVYVPSLKWVYSGLAATPLNVSRLLAVARARGWQVERYGSLRGLLSPVPK